MVVSAAVVVVAAAAAATVFLPEHGDEEVEHQYVGDDDVDTQQDRHNPDVCRTARHCTILIQCWVVRTSFHCSSNIEIYKDKYKDQSWEYCRDRNLRSI